MPLKVKDALPGQEFVLLRTGATFTKISEMQEGRTIYSICVEKNSHGTIKLLSNESYISGATPDLT